MDLFNMPDEVKIPESQKPFLRTIYIDKYKNWQERKVALENEYQELKPMLAALGIIEIKSDKIKSEPKSLSHSNPAESIDARLKDVFDSIDMTILLSGSFYDDNWSWLKKCKYVLDSAHMRLTSNEIIEVIIKFFETTASRTALNNSIPATLSVAAKDGKIFREKKENGEYEYFLK